MMNDEVNDMDNQVQDVDEINLNEIKINPDIYIHNAILKAQGSLTNPDVKVGFLQFRILVENIETLCRASSRLPPDYDKDIIAYKEEDGYKKEPDTFVKNVNLAHKKLELLLTHVFASRTSTQPLTL